MLNQYTDQDGSRRPIFDTRPISWTEYLATLAILLSVVFLLSLSERRKAEAKTAEPRTVLVCKSEPGPVACWQAVPPEWAR